MIEQIELVDSSELFCLVTERWAIDLALLQFLREKASQHETR